MAGMFSSGEQDMLGNIIQQRQQANQALGSGYGKYGGIVQAAGGMADTMGDIVAGGGVGASDPRMQQMNEIKNIFSQVALEVGTTTSAAFYTKLAQALSAKYPEQAQKAADKAAEITKADTAAADETKNVYELIDSTDTWGNPIKKQVMVTYKKNKRGEWVKWGTQEADESNYGNEGQRTPAPPMVGQQGAKKESRGTVEIGAPIQSEIAKTIPLGKLEPRDEGGGLVGAEPEGMPPADERPMQFPKKDEVKQLVENRKFLLQERQRLQKQGKSTAQVDKSLRANQAKLAEMQAKLERK